MRRGLTRKTQTVNLTPTGNVLWNGDLPAARGPVAKVFAKIPLASQRQDSALLLTFLQDPEAELAKLNAEPKLIAALVSLPDSALVMVVYRMV